MFFRNELFLKRHILNTSSYYSLVYARTGGPHLSGLGLGKRQTQSHGSRTTSDCQVKSQLLPGSSSTSCLSYPSKHSKAGAADGAAIVEEEGTVSLQGKLVVSPLLLRRTCVYVGGSHARWVHMANPH